MRWWTLWIPLVVACSEYDLKGTAQTAQGTTSTPPPTTETTPPPTTTPGEDCPDVDQPGYDAAINEDCETVIQTGTFTPVLEWSMSTFSSVGSDVMSAPMVADLDLDGVPDVVFVTYYPGTVRAVRGDGGGEMWSQTGVEVQITGGVAIGNLDADPFVEIVSLRTSGVAIFEHDGTVKTVIDNLAGAIYGTSDVPSISDMDHDGVPEIIAGRAILNADGTLRGMGAYGMGGVGTNVGTCSFAVDLDLDGTEEVVTGNALYRPDGSAIWNNGQPDGYPAVGNFDADPEGEIVVVAQGSVRLLDTDGSLINGWNIPGAALSSGYGGPPTVADFDGDGAAEIGVAAGSQYSVFEADGSLRWQAITDDSSSGNTGSTVFDFEGDGVAEVVYADQTRLWVFDGRDGAVKLASTDHSNATWLEYPTVADVDADGHAEIITVRTTYLTATTGIAVFGDQNDSWQPGRQIWNQHAYHITNIADDGSVPVTAATNWATYNNFRSGDLNAGSGTFLPDLVVGDPQICEIDCDEGRVVLWFHPGNQGLADVTAVDAPTVDLFAVTGGVETLVDSTALTDVVSGEYVDAVVFDVTGVDPTTVDSFVARIHSNRVDCDPSNDDLVWDGPFCESGAE